MNRTIKRLSKSMVFEDCVPIKKSRHPDYTATLPDEILIQIFTYFNHKELCSIIKRVCKRWYSLSSTATLWKKIIAHEKVPLKILCSWLERSPLLKEFELSERNRKEINTVARTISKFCKNIESFKVKNTVNYNSSELLESKALCGMMDNCKYLTNLYFSGVKILSCKFFQMLAERKPNGSQKKCSYFGPVNQRQMKALVESIVANDYYDAATLFSSGNKKISIQEICSNGEDNPNIDLIWNDIVNYFEMNDNDYQPIDQDDEFL